MRDHEKRTSIRFYLFFPEKIDTAVKPCIRFCLLTSKNFIWKKMPAPLQFSLIFTNLLMLNAALCATEREEDR